MENFNTRMNKLIFFGLFYLATSISFAATINVRLIIHSGTRTLVDGTQILAKTFSTSSSFSENSEIFIWNKGDDVNLKIVNLDSEIHSFTIDGFPTFGTIAAGDSITQNIVLNNAGVFRYYDDLNAPFNQYIGLSGLIHVKEITDNSTYFYWDLRELDSVWNAEIIVNAAQPTLTDYEPDYFTVNGKSHPNVNNDPIARPVGSVGQEFKIVILNNGLSIHSMHFHGYHLTILEDSKKAINVGRSKDTFPIYPNEHLILSCTPDKPGEYPVHDHNLAAVSSGGVYATGMFLTLNITP